MITILAYEIFLRYAQQFFLREVCALGNLRSLVGSDEENVVCVVAICLNIQKRIRLPVPPFVKCRRRRGAVRYGSIADLKAGELPIPNGLTVLGAAWAEARGSAQTIGPAAVAAVMRLIFMRNVCSILIFLHGE